MLAHVVIDPRGPSKRQRADQVLEIVYRRAVTAVNGSDEDSYRLVTRLINQSSTNQCVYKRKSDGRDSFDPSLDDGTTTPQVTEVSEMHDAVESVDTCDSNEASDKENSSSVKRQMMPLHKLRAKKPTKT